MKCSDCDNCIEDYGGNPYCFMKSIQLDEEDMSTDNAEFCIDYEPKEGEE